MGGKKKEFAARPNVQILAYQWVSGLWYTSGGIYTWGMVFA